MKEIVNITPEKQALWALLFAGYAMRDVREALRKIPLTSPRHKPGTEPSAADACFHILQNIDYCLVQLTTFVGPIESHKTDDS